MKKTVLAIVFIFCANIMFGQNGLENVLVEKYYVSDANDSVVNDGISAAPGTLPAGSVTYRVYVDMKPGFQFQAAYGIPVGTVPIAHELKIQTSTRFYNNEDRGSWYPSYTKAQAANNTVMLDSWLTAGAAAGGSGGYFGIPLNEDNGVGTVSNNDNALQNTNPFTGIALTQQDGLIQVTGKTPSSVGKVGIDSLVSLFLDQSTDPTIGQNFITDNGSWYSLTGATGPDTSNKVLIGQFTTDGIFSFELNLQLRDTTQQPQPLVENYVAKNASGNEILCPKCIYSSTQGIFTPSLAADKISFAINPNPVSDLAYIQIQSDKRVENGSYTVFDAVGKAVISGMWGSLATRSNQRLDVSSLSTGLYVLELNLDGKKASRKLVVQ